MSGALELTSPACEYPTVSRKLLKQIGCNNSDDLWEYIRSASIDYTTSVERLSGAKGDVLINSIKVHVYHNKITSVIHYQTKAGIPKHVTLEFSNPYGAMLMV